MKIIVLGSGLVGGPMAADLAAEPGFKVSVADIDPASLARLKKKAAVETIAADLSDPASVRKIVSDFDLVLSAMPGSLGFETLRTVVDSGKDVVDISFFPEDPFALDALALEKAISAVVDCGVAPGMSNLLVGHAHSLLDSVASVLIYVGGLPEVREWPYDYKAGFSPADVIEEYTRPARYVQNGAVVVRPALSEAELLNFAGIGTLEAFNTDGLRTLIRTVPAPDMREKTLRYPGHIEKMAVLRETGFFGQEEIEVKGVRVRPRDVTAKLLFPIWKMGPGDRDITLMRIIVDGSVNGVCRRFTFDLQDRFDSKTGVHSMARTTGYTATMAVRMLARGLYSRHGIIAPEFIGREPECVEFILAGLKSRGVVVQKTLRNI